MRLANVVVAVIILYANLADAQQQLPRVLFGISTPDQTSGYERFEIEHQEGGTVIRSAPYGKTPRSWGSLTVTQNGAIEFHWAGDPRVRCSLSRVDERNYRGACRSSGHLERPLILTRWNEPTDGRDLSASEVDLRILARARQYLSGPSVWNRRDDRACEDDAAQASWSLFCALYHASVTITGEYLHARPVMTEARSVLASVTRGRPFQHPIMDFNNLASTTYAEIAKIFDLTEERLRAKAGLTPPSSGSSSPTVDTATLRTPNSLR